MNHVSQGPDILKREIDDLVLEQIHSFKQPSALSERQLFEYHLRHMQLLALYRHLHESVNGKFV